MPIGFKGNPLGNYTAPHTSPPLYQSIYNTEGELVFERDVRTTANGGYLFANTEVSQAIGEIWNVATPYMCVAQCMFSGDTTLKTVSTGADFSSVFNGGYMFYNCSNLENVCVQFPKLEYCYSMFRGCKSLTELPDLDYEGDTLQYGQQMFRDSGLEGNIGKSGYYDEDGNWHPYELFAMNGFSGNDTSNEYNETTKASPRGMFYGCTNLTEVYISFPNATCMSDIFSGCTSLKKLVLHCPKVTGNSSPTGAMAVSGFCRFAFGCSNLEILDVYDPSGARQGQQCIYGCPKLRYFDLQSTTWFSATNGIVKQTNVITIGKKFAPTLTDKNYSLQYCKLSLETVQRLLKITCGSSLTTLYQLTFNLGIGLQEGLKTRTTPSYVIDAGYYDYENGSESTDPQYIHNYYDLDGNPVIEHDVHEPYISTEQPKDADGNLLTTWSAVKNGVTYWAIGELREALDDALGKRWYNIKLYFN